MPLFGRSKPALIDSAPKGGDPVTFDEEEECVVSGRRAGLAASTEDTFYDAETAREVLNSQVSRALLGLALRRLRARDFRGAASTCIKALGTWESGAAWWIAAEVHRSYGDRQRAKGMLENADEVAHRFGLLQSGAKPYRENYRTNELKKTLATGQENLALDALINLELEVKVDYLRRQSGEQANPYATISQWLAAWDLTPRLTDSGTCPSCGQQIHPTYGISSTSYFCSCGFMYSEAH